MKLEIKFIKKRYLKLNTALKCIINSIKINYTLLIYGVLYFFT